ncbi:unnamed protein product [Camellia sinensis]
MECGGGILSSFFNTRRRREEAERYESFLENGSKVLEEFITKWNGQCSIPIRNFSAGELIRSTNNFDCQHWIDQDAFYNLYRGSFGERPILVKYNHIPDFPTTAFTVRDIAVRDIVITSQMSSQKIVVKLIGCCLEFQYPVLVYEGLRSSEQLLSRSLYKREGDMANHDDGSSLSLKTRVRIANDIAYAFVYLHTAFPTSIIHRSLKSNNVIIDRCGGAAKLLDFSFSIAIPPEESHVEDSVIGTSGFMEPEYCLTGILTVKTNVYDFGMILVELLTGQRIGALHRQYESLHMQYESLQDYLHNGGLNEILDAKIRGEGGGVVQEQQLQALVELAMQCLQKEREDRPEMIDVAKEVKRIQRLVQTPISSTINPL